MMDVAPHARVAEIGSMVIVQIAGRATMDMAEAVRLYLEGLPPSGESRRLQVDLRHCPYMDSTFQGLLLVLAGVRRQDSRWNLQVVSPSESCQQLLRANRFDRVLSIVECNEAIDGEWRPLTIDADRAAPEFQRSVLEAHERIVELDGPTAERYRNVVKLMRGENP